MEDYKVIKPFSEGKGYLIENAGYIDPNYDKNKQILKEFEEQKEAGFTVKEPLIIYAVLQKYGVENENGRIYPEAILKRENDKYQFNIKNRSAYGENNHADTSIIDSERLAINILETWWEGHTLMGKIEVLMSPGFIKLGIISCQGDYVANWLRLGLTIGISSRGLGSVKKIAGKTIVQADYELICWDVVTTPSTPGSYLVKNREDMNQFKEGKISAIKPLLSEKFDKLKNNKNKFII